ncbi:hypothetical protein Pint_00465 [Pistacia integerrima]|uniref:Uncharacterized protein n=1 Tax=Pistacia integerrima TaxID=434235 RepID=A0ACC0ZR31_9ROSI|nr:hypothetical protein Pint_00465 [Pistacia integerrima]
MPRLVEFALIVIYLLLGSLNVNSLPCDDRRCKTGSCNSSGDCVCNLPDPSTILEGDRSFLGGEFCDEEMTMCDGTNSFWCEHGGSCKEIVQGEKYECKCVPGYTGEHCEHRGVPCGQIFCFHLAECLVEGEACNCPPDWKGSADCSVPTKPLTDSSRDSTTAKFPQVGSINNTNWTMVLLGVLFSVGAVAGGTFYAKKLLKNKVRSTAPKFQQLSQMQTPHDILDDDEEDDSMVPDVILRDTSHL